MYGKIIMASRGKRLEDYEQNGVCVYECDCGKKLNGISTDPTFAELVYSHIEECRIAHQGVGQYPEETSMGGRCIECVHHAGSGGGRCKNIFVNAEGKAMSRCNCQSTYHKKQYMGDSSMRGR